MYRCEMPELAPSLDPALRPVLEALNANGMGSLAGATVEEARAKFRMLTVDARRPEHVVPVGSIDDIEVGGANGPLPARVYRLGAGGPLPTIVYFHGGGFVIGDIDTHDNQCRV